MSSEPTKNIFLFYGEDDFSLRQKIQVWKDEFVKKYSSQGVVLLNSDGLSEVELGNKLKEALAPSLFSTKKLIIARNYFPTKSSQEILIANLTQILTHVPSDYFLIFWQDALDKRLAFTKKILKEVSVFEFHLPHGRELNTWIAKQARILGFNLDDRAIDKLALLSGRDLYEEKKIAGRVVERKEFFNLWQIYSDLQKLASFSSAPNANDVGELVVPKVSENVFALSDAIVSQDKKNALDVLEKLMSEDNSDEKSMAIKLLGLISEQIRSQLVVNLLKNQNMDQNQIANFMGWSPGRVFITLKNSGNFKLDKLKQLLSKLLSADAVLKSSDTNPKLLIDLLIAN